MPTDVERDFIEPLEAYMQKMPINQNEFENAMSEIDYSNIAKALISQSSKPKSSYPSFIKVNSVTLAQALEAKIQFHNDKIVERKQKTIQFYMSRKPFLFFFNKPAKTSEEAEAMSKEENKYGYEEDQLHQMHIVWCQSLLTACEFSDTVNVSVDDFKKISAFMPEKNKGYR